MEPEVDILADDVGLMGEYPVDCLRAVFTGYFLFLRANSPWERWAEDERFKM